MSYLKKTVTVEFEESVKEESVKETGNGHCTEKAGSAIKNVAPKNIGELDMVIAFDTTGSMAQYIDNVRRDVEALIPQLFKDNKDLRLGIVAFGDYCDMKGPKHFGDAYQVIHPTDDVDKLISFVRNSKNTSGGDGPEFYELVIKKIVEETQWRPGSTRSVLLIADSEPHELGYSYENFVVDNRIDWREEARKAANKRIKIDTVSITGYYWFRELSAMTNGVNVPFFSGHKTTDLVRASVSARGSMKSRESVTILYKSCQDPEMEKVYEIYEREGKKF